MFKILKYWRSIIAINLLLASCGESEPAGIVQNDEALIQNIQTPYLDLEINEPEEFLSFIRQAINVDSLELIQAACHPDRSRVRDQQTMSFCNIAWDTPDNVADFKRWYINSEVQGEIWSNLDTAWIPTRLADGEKASILVLERSNDLWYLVLMGISD